MNKIIKEDAPLNSVGTGAIAGTTGEPPGPINTIMKLLRRKKQKEANNGIRTE